MIDLLVSINLFRSLRRVHLNMVNSDVKTSFDHYGRYFFIAKIIDANRNKNKLTILDVGGFGGELEKFLPNDDITIIDTMSLPSNHKKIIVGDALNLPFFDQEFDFVVSADTLEHISQEKRNVFLDESFRVSKGTIIIAAPFETTGVVESEYEINLLYKSLFNVDYPWLKEHIENGLPKLELVKEWAKKHSLNTQIYGNNDIEEWKTLMSHYFISEFYKTDKSIKVFSQRCDEYNRTQNQYPAQGLSYRKVLVLSSTKPNKPNFIKVSSTEDFKSPLPMLKTIQLYIDKINSPVSDQDYVQASINVGAYIPTEDAHEKQLSALLASTQSELAIIKSSLSWQAITWLRSHKLYCFFIAYAWKLFRYILIKQRYKTYLYPPNLIWRLKTGIPAYGRRRYNNLTFKQNKRPVISIIIPIYGRPELTINCLEALTKIKTAFSFEIILVDDHSKGRAYSLFANIPNVKYIRNDKNSGFVISCNTGAKLSKGKYLVFLNNDTIVDKHWLDPLIDRLEQNKEAGLVGSLLMYPNKTIQEAGGIIFSDGSGWNYGHGDPNLSYEYSYAREVDYCSGASIAIRSELFHDIGGFDKRYIPAYYEDTDLAFSVRKKGYKVFYEPKSIVQHIEGASSGTDTTKGMKRFQPINHIKFVEKWNSTLEKEQYLSPAYLPLAKDRSAKKLALIIDHYVPEPDKDSGSVRMRAMIKIIQDLGYKVTFWPQNLLESRKYSSELKNEGVEVVYGPVDFLNFSKARGVFYNLVILSRPSVAPAYIDIIKSLYINAAIVFDTVDLSFIRLGRQAKVEKNEDLAKLSEGWKKVELGLMLKTDATLVVSEEEKKVLSSLLPSTNIGVVSNIVTAKQGPLLPFANRSGLIFIGGFSHLPNIDAVIWFCEEIMPEIIKSIPNIIFRIIGSNPPQRVLDLENKNIRVMGFVEDVNPIFNISKLFISPLRYGAGVKGKVNQAMQYGLPVIGTSISFEGMHMKNGQDCVVANTKKEFVKSIIDMYSNESKWNSISKNSQEILKEYFSPEVAKKSLSDIINKLDA